MRRQAPACLDLVIWTLVFAYWNRPDTALTRNIRFVHNTCVNAGHGWAHGQRPDRNGSHLMFYTNAAPTSGFVVKHNIFCNSTDWGMRMETNWREGLDMDYGLWFEAEGTIAFFLRRRLPASDFAGYQDKTGFDAHSLFARPKFVAPATLDFRLAADSPGRTLPADGAVVGARKQEAASE